MKEEAQNDHDKKPCKKKNLEKLFTYLYEDLNHSKFKKTKKDIIDNSLNFIYDVDKGPENTWIRSFKASIYETEIPKSLLEETDKKKNINIKLKIARIHEIHSKTINDIINKGWTSQKNKIGKFDKKIKAIKYLIIYEAPPSKIDISKKTHVGDFILNKTSTSPYKNAICAAFDSLSENDLSTILVKENTYFTDIIPVPIPFNPTIRKAWATEEKFNIDGKQLTVHLFEKAIIEFAIKFRGKIAKDLIIAIGMPRNTSAALYDYYSSKVHYVVDCADGICIVDKKPVFCGYLFKIDLTKTNAVLATKKINIPTLKGITLPLFESCFVDTSGQPNGTLLKIALGLEIK
jgi:hypothetical protein